VTPSRRWRNFECVHHRIGNWIAGRGLCCRRMLGFTPACELRNRGPAGGRAVYFPRAAVRPASWKLKSRRAWRSSHAVIAPGFSRPELLGPFWGWLDKFGLAEARSTQRTLMRRPCVARRPTRTPGRHRRQADYVGTTVPPSAKVAAHPRWRPQSRPSPVRDGQVLIDLAAQTTWPGRG